MPWAPSEPHATKHTEEFSGQLQTGTMPHQGAAGPNIAANPAFVHSPRKRKNSNLWKEIFGITAAPG